MYRGVSSFKLTKHLLGVESSLAPMYSKIPVRRICDKKEYNFNYTDKFKTFHNYSLYTQKFKTCALTILKKKTPKIYFNSGTFTCFSSLLLPRRI